LGSIRGDFPRRIVIGGNPFLEAYFNFQDLPTLRPGLDIGNQFGPPFGCPKKGMEKGGLSCEVLPKRGLINFPRIGKFFLKKDWIC